MSNPSLTNDLAESPSVKIRVHDSECLVPANLASSNFGTFIIVHFFPSVFLFIIDCSFSLENCNISSAIPVCNIFFNVFSPRVYLDPKSDALFVRYSFVWLLNCGSSMTQSINTVRYSLTYDGLMCIDLCFFCICFIIPDTI